MLYGTPCQAMLAWACLNRRAVAGTLRRLGTKDASKLADSVQNHQRGSLDAAVELLFDPAAQAELAIRARREAEARARFAADMAWQTELCISALLLSDGSLGAGPVRDLVVELAMPDTPRKLSRLPALRARLCRSLAAAPCRPRSGDKHGAMVAEATPAGAVVSWRHDPRLRDSRASRGVQLTLGFGLALGQDPFRPNVRRVRCRGDAPAYRDYRIVVAAPDTVAPHHVGVSVAKLTTRGRQDWAGQYPELYAKPVPSFASEGIWHKWAPNAAAMNPLLGNARPVTVVVAASRPTPVARPEQQDWQALAYATMEQLDSLMDGPGLLGTMAAEWVADLVSAELRGWDRFDARQIVRGAMHFVRLECSRLSRWGCLSQEAQRVALATLPATHRVLAGLAKVAGAQACRRRKCQHMASYRVNGHNYCTEHALALSSR